MQRFFVSDDAIANGKVHISGDNARHISLSLRMRVGDRISVCTPNLMCHTCILTAFSESEVLAEVEKSEPCDTEPPYRVKLYQAVPKGDKLEMIVQKAVECGVYSITPFHSKFCIAKIERSQEKKLTRLKRIAEEAAKQCGRGIIPNVSPPMSFDEMIKNASSAELPLFCYEERGGVPLGTLLHGNQSEISIVIGPEGGFSKEEAEAAIAHGMIPVGLGNRILRCETAPTFVLSCISLIRELS